MSELRLHKGEGLGIDSEDPDLHSFDTHCAQCDHFKRISKERKIKDCQETDGTGDGELNSEDETGDIDDDEETDGTVDEQETDDTDEEELGSEHEEYDE